MKKKLIWATALLVCAMLFVSACGTKETTEEEQKDVTEKLVSRDWEVIKEEGTLKVATSGTYFPNSYHDEESNELTGFEVEILREIANRLGLEVEFTEMGVDGMLTSLNSEQIDIAALGIDRDGENADKYNFTIPYKYSFGSMVVREEDNSGIEKLEDLKGKKAAGAATTSYMKVAEKFGAELVIYDNATNDQYLWDVANGRTDVVLNDYYGQLMATEALPEIPVKVHDVFYNPSETNYAIKLGNDEFTKQINAQLEAMHDDGTLSEISKQFYNGEDVTVQKDYEFQEIDVSKE
ncbi:transporter substrate-binding domain-containing protein [Desemzia incerta]|uniref:transporter substrate-binding domain-containing protein n=1 Tax=Desemzia incerta TaxID=82801 RepID=UPI0024C23659|nr:transporter substrate-binding domain-containing protein [Desemzia incerta]WHZ32977.1 transporter substrate-binding domain-containing protein [Desemzia incerta]